MVKNDRWIREMAQKGMIEPFGDTQKREGIISYGVGSYGYDMRIGEDFIIGYNPDAYTRLLGLEQLEEG